MMVKSILQLVLQNREEMEKQADVVVGFYPTAKTPTVTQETVEDYKKCRNRNKARSKTLGRLLAVG